VAPTLTGAVVLPTTTTIGTVTDTEISYLSGVTSAIQTQLNTKATVISPTITGTLTVTDDFDLGNITNGATFRIIGKSGSSYSYDFSTKSGGVLRIISNKGGALPFDLDADGGVVCGKIDSSGAFGSSVKAFILRNTTAHANGNEITQNFYFNSSAWTNNIQAQLAVVTDGYSAAKLVYRSHDMDEGAANDLVERFEVTTSGSLKIDSTESLGAAYSTGFFGDGYKIIETGGETTAEFDNVIVRKLMRVYLLEVDKIDVIGGSLIISPASGTVYAVSGTNLYFDTNNNTNPIQFKIGDYIAAQQWVNYDHTTLASYRGHVTAVHQSATLGSAYIETTTVSGTAWAGMRLAQLGSSSDAARQNLLYLTSSDTNNPFIEGHTTVTAGVLTDTTRMFRLGNLTGITDSIMGALSGFGLYTQNAYLTGKLILPDAGVTNEGTGVDYVRFFAGDAYANRTTAPFRVTETGGLYAAGYVELGTQLVGAGGNFSVLYNEIWNNQRDADDYLSINYYGYNKGTTRFRNLKIFDGKTASIAEFDGVNGLLRVDKNLTVTGNAIFNGTLQIPDLASAPSSPTLGMIYVSTATGRFYGYNGASWILLDYNP
jgi:hypothetical protein